MFKAHHVLISLKTVTSYSVLPFFTRIESGQLQTFKESGRNVDGGEGRIGGSAGSKDQHRGQYWSSPQATCFRMMLLMKGNQLCHSLQEIGRQSTSLLGSLHLLGNLSSLQGDISDGLADLRETGDYFGFVRHVRGGLAESYYKVRVITVQQCSSATCCT